MSCRQSSANRVSASNRELVEGDVSLVGTRMSILDKNYSLVFNGGGAAKIDLTTNAGLQSDDSFTFVLRFSPNFTGGGTYGPLFGRGGNESGGFGLLIRKNTKTIRFFYNGGAILFDPTDFDLSKRWHEISVSYSSGQIRLILDGKKIYNRAITLGARAADLKYWSGVWEGFNSNRYNGDIAYIKFWKRGFTEDEQLRLSYLDYPTDGPDADWNMEAGTGDTVIDHSGNGHDGTLSSGVSWGFDIPNIFGLRSQCLLDYSKVSQHSLVAEAGSVDWGLSGQTEREFLNSGWADRVRQTGNVLQVRLWVSNPAIITEFHVVFWRKDGATYNVVGTTENIARKLKPNRINIIQLDTPVPVQEGDYTGYRIVQSEAGLQFNALVGLSAAHGSRVYNGIADEEDFDWDTQTKTAGITMPVECMMVPPDIACIGDSITAGHNIHSPYTENGTEDNPSVSYPYKLNALLNGSYQNFGIGSQTVAMISERFSRDIVDNNIKTVFINGGVNDINMGVSESDTLQHYTSMLDKSVTAGITVYIIAVLPWDNGTTVQMQAVDSLNAELVTLAAGYANTEVIDPTSAVGVFRAGGDPGNLWDQNALYSDPDGVHWNEAGHQAIADYIFSQI